MTDRWISCCMTLSCELQDLSNEGARYEGHSLDDVLVELLTVAKHEAARRNAECESSGLDAVTVDRRDQ